jgi:predicted unusual protein kinase regulating ubiquinone biosynthesis (AarF/ABC1/UbiB family)
MATDKNFEKTSTADRRERSRLSRRVKRYAAVGGSVGGLAAQAAFARLFKTGFDRDRHSADLGAALGQLKGPLMKVAQILATIPDALPESYAKELRKLQSQAPAMGWPFVRRRMRGELGADWQQKFQDFSREAAAAASLGQVHKARGLDGRELACKLQYPDMASAVEADLQQLKFAISLYRRYDQAIDPGEVYEELCARLREELDYDLEARHMALYRHMLAKEEGIRVPDALPELCTGRLLTMTWLEGRPLLDFVKEADQAQCNLAARRLFRAWYLPFYNYGVIHGDPHLGNYSLDGDIHLNLLDFGCIRIFPPSFVKGVIDLYHALDRDDPDLAVEAYACWGFKNLDEEMLSVLNIWAAFLYGPLLEDKPQKIMGKEGSLYGAEVAGHVHRELRRLGGVRPPREFVLMDRAAIGLGSVFMHLKAEINWHRLFRELAENFSVEDLAARQSVALATAGLSGPCAATAKV